jgi:nucleotide-binding universal stress UspA family protein
LTDASPHQVNIAARIAGALQVPMVLTHVLPPVHAPEGVAWADPTGEMLKHADTTLRGIASTLSDGVTRERVILTGEPAGEIAALAARRHPNLIVMGLHSSGLLGPRMGSVTYRVLCHTHALVLALPPHVHSNTPVRVAAGSAVTRE